MMVVVAFTLYLLSLGLFTVSAIKLLMLAAQAICGPPASWRQRLDPWYWTAGGLISFIAATYLSRL